MIPLSFWYLDLGRLSSSAIVEICPRIRMLLTMVSLAGCNETFSDHFGFKGSCVCMARCSFWFQRKLCSVFTCRLHDINNVHLCLVFCGRIKDFFVVKALKQLCSGRPHGTVLVHPCSQKTTWACCQRNLMLEEILQGCLGVLLVQTMLMRSLQHSVLHPCMVIQFQAPAAGIVCVCVQVNCCKKRCTSAGNRRHIPVQ